MGEFFKSRCRLLTVSLGLLLATFCLASPASVSSFTVNSNNFTSANVTSHIEYYIDRSGRLSLDQIKSLPEDAWLANTEDNLRFGFSSDVYWLRFEVRNQTAHPLLLEASNPIFDLIEVHLDGTEGETVQLGGLKIPPAQRATENRLPLFHLPASEDKTVWIKTSNSGSYLLSFKLWSESEFDKKYAQDMMLYGIYFGILIVAVTLFLIGFIALREIALLSLTCLTFSFTVFQTTLLGIGANQLWSPADYYRSVLALSLGASIIAAYFFFSQGLKLKTESIIGEWVLKIIASITLVVLLAMSVMGYQSTALSLTYLMLASSIAVVVISFRMALKGNQLALFSSIASAAVLLGSVQQALVRLQIIPASMHVEHAIYLGFLFLIGCLALGIGFEVHRRHNNYEQYKETLNAQNRAHQESLNLALESEVKARTEELETALSKLSSAHESLKLLNTVDQVTGTKNRYYFDTTFSQEWKRASREQYPLSILMLDVDHFKRLNDTYGHVVGDECLRQIGERLAGEIKRAADTLARFGGEEFVILLPYSSNENAVAMAEQLRLCIAEKPLQVDGKAIQVFVSIGVSTIIPRENGLPKDLITSADQALYEAKDAGRNRVCNAGKLAIHNNHQDKKA